MVKCTYNKTVMSTEIVSCWDKSVYAGFCVETNFMAAGNSQSIVVCQRKKNAASRVRTCAGKSH